MTRETLLALAEFQEEAARYFSNRPTNGEDAAHWANVYNAENCTKTAEFLRARAACLVEGEGGDA